MRDTSQLDWSLVDPGFEIHDHELFDALVQRGRQGWTSWVTAWREAFNDFRLDEIDQVELDEQRILTVHRLWARGSASGVELERTDAQLWTFKDDLLVRLDYYPNYRPGEQWPSTS